jgi:hypothetical protein
MIAAIGSGRMVMGSDHPPNLAVELAKWRATGIAGSDLEAVFSHTPRRLFGLPPAPGPA